MEYVGRNIYNPSTATWTREQEKLFETGLVIYPEGTQDRWFRIAERVPGKNQYEVVEHYKVLVDDIMEIEAGNVELPNYLDDDVDDYYDQSEPTTTKKTIDRKRGIPWTKEEHRNFLLGLEKLSRGDWRSISRLYVKSRNPTQVASHAQKYFKHLENKNKKERKRASIHDTPLVVAEDNNKNSLNAPGVVAHTPFLHPNHQSLTKIDDPYRRGQGGSVSNIHDMPLVVAEDNKKNYFNSPGGVAHAPVMMHPNKQSLPKLDDPYRRGQGGSFGNIGDSQYIS
ncbi:hypothetical protein MKX01_029702 [Papaver californicum]|nr:hypothetical protein MKX01_029702 [Papaver californicum]